MKCVSVYVQHWNLDLIAGALSCCWGEFSRLTTSLGSEVGRGRSGDDDDNDDDDDIDVDVYTIPLIVGQRPPPNITPAQILRNPYSLISKKTEQSTTKSPTRVSSIRTFNNL